MSQSVSQEEALSIIQGMIDDGEAIDVTETIQCYEKGKTWDCTNCGQGIGTDYDGGMIKCASCGLILIDSKWREREPPKREEGQSSLGSFT